ncbi:MAG: HAD family hydrolase [Herpetosiphon sp.]|nr:HAD family hydrolase [Herpetosiphon sp.]
MNFDPSRVQALIFDVDGTLRDTDDELVNRVAGLLKPIQRWLPFQNPRHTARRIVMHIEDPAQIMLYIPDRLGIDRYTFALVTHIRRLIWHTKPKHDYRVIAGVKFMLEQLAGRYPLAVASAGPQESVHAFLETTGLHGYFQCVASALTCHYTKPYPDPLWWCANRLHVASQHCVMIGDTTVDMRAGQAAGMQTIGVLCGFGEHDELERSGASLITGSTANVRALLST